MRETKQGVLIDKEDTGQSKSSPVTSLVVGCVALVLGIYLLNPTFGVFELLPDNLPIVGQLDEVAATTGLLACLSYFGIDLPWFRKKP